MSCPKCGKSEPHFVGPSLGESGFYICEQQEAKPTSDLRRDAEALYAKLNTPNHYLNAIDIATIEQELKAQRWGVWEEAASIADVFANCMEEDLPHAERLQRLTQQTTAQYIAKRCRAKAEEPTP